MWDLSLVDPDNRRPVDYDLRARIAECAAPPAIGEWQSAKPKLELILRLLALRAEHPEDVLLAPDGRWRNALRPRQAPEALQCRELFAEFPAAVLVGTGAN